MIPQGSAWVNFYICNLASKIRRRQDHTTLFTSKGTLHSLSHQLTNFILKLLLIAEVLLGLYLQYFHHHHRSDILPDIRTYYRHIANEFPLD